MLTCEAKKKHYKLSLDLYEQIVPEDCKYTVVPRHIFVVIAKKDEEAEYWPYLVKNKKKESHI